jgi:hypothetical protein
MVGDAAGSVIRERPQGAEALPHFEFAYGFPATGIDVGTDARSPGA